LPVGHLVLAVTWTIPSSVSRSQRAAEELLARLGWWADDGG
jgi:hypothetical protein